MTIEEDNEIAKQERISRLRDRARVFREIFTSPNGKLIMEAFSVKFGHTLPPNVLGTDGHTDPYQTWRRLGHFDVLEYIKTQIEWREDVSTSNGSNT